MTTHLVGGMAVLTLLWWLTVLAHHGAAGAQPPGDTVPSINTRAGLRLLAHAGLLLLAMQIALGGWVAANHATLACQGFPTCNGSWWPSADIADGYAPLAGRFPDAGMSGPGRIAIHLIHRLGAAGLLLILGVLAALAGRARHPPPLRRPARLLGLLVLVQVGLGASIVLAGAPLALAAAHNAVAALLLLQLVTLICRLGRSRSSVADADDPNFPRGLAPRRIET